MVINYKERGYGEPSPPVRKLHIPGPDSPRGLLAYLEGLNLKAQEPEIKDLSFLVQFGAVYVNHERCTDALKILTPQDIIRIHVDPRRYPLSKSDLQKRIVFENEFLVAVNKPCGLPMHATLDNLHENLIAGFDSKYFLTHRLDVPTSGLVILAKTKEYQSRFNILVMKRLISKKYKALVAKPMSPARLIHYIKNDDKAPKQIAAQPVDSSWQDCILDIEACTPLYENYILDISLLTGRTHQIRAQLAFEGNPILGDVMYGGIKHPIFGLHAWQLSFQCPVRKENLNFKAEPDWILAPEAASDKPGDKNVKS